MEARESVKHMKEGLKLRPEVTGYFSTENIEGVMDPEVYIDISVEQVEIVV